jgi:RNA chaperone Hfq
MAIANQINLQDSFLNQIRKESIPVDIYLKNGVQLRGLVKGFDAFMVSIEDAGKHRVAYKHAIK